MVKLGVFAATLFGWSIACAAAPTTSLTPDGLGPLRIGMRETEAATRLGLKIAPDDGVYSFDCREDDYPKYPGVSAMAERGIVTRIVIDSPSKLQTDKGLRLGSNERDVHRAYATRLSINTRPYDDEPAHELIAWSKGRKRGIRYDTDATGRVVAIFAGGKSIEYIEGCL